VIIMTKKITNLNTLNALIRDEEKAYEEYYYMSRNRELSNNIRNNLIRMALEERGHANFLKALKDKLTQKENNNGKNT